MTFVSRLLLQPEDGGLESVVAGLRVAATFAMGVKVCLKTWYQMVWVLHLRIFDAGKRF